MGKRVNATNPYRPRDLVELRGRILSDVDVLTWDYYDEFKSLLLHALKIDGVDFVTAGYIKSCLIDRGAVGYDKVTNKWASVFGNGINELGLPTKLNFVFRNGRSFSRPAAYENINDGAYIIFALATLLPFGDIILRTAKELAVTRSVRLQNLDAVRAPCVVVVSDPDAQLSLEHAIQQREHGKSVILVSEMVAQSLKSIDNNTPYLVDKLDAHFDIERNALLNKLGIMTSNTDKRERVQTAEVNATIGECSDYIQTFIDNFNQQCDEYGINVKMTLNNALDAYMDQIYIEDKTQENGEYEI